MRGQELAKPVNKLRPKRWVHLAARVPCGLCMGVAYMGLEELPKARRKKLRKRLRKYGRKHRREKHHAEEWFWACWKKSGMFSKKDRSNLPLGFFIPDVVNFGYAYVIEIDEPYHSDPKQQSTDRRKDAFFNQLGFDVFRIPAFDEKELQSVIEKIKVIRQQGHKARRKQRIRRYQAFRTRKNSYKKRKQAIPDFVRIKSLSNPPSVVRSPKPFVPKTILRKK